jgi:transcriptional regulator with XRE-family HTH domain
MACSIDYTVAAPVQIAADLGRRLERLRLARNERRADLAGAAGISTRTLARLETSGRATVETLVRVMTALGLQDPLRDLLPDPTLRPIERVDTGGKSRQRARPKKMSRKGKASWTWGDES